MFALKLSAQLPNQRQHDMKLSTITRSLLLLSLLLARCVSQAAESASEHDQRMAWFREARFGLFIHWGLYSVPAGEWNGEPVRGAGEWIMQDAKIPVSQYEKLV